MEDSVPWEGPRAGAGAEREEGAAEAACDEQTAAAIPVPPCRSGEEVEKSGVKLSLGRREGWGEGVLRFGVFSLPDLIGNKLH